MEYRNKVEKATTIFRQKVTKGLIFALETDNNSIEMKQRTHKYDYDMKKREAGFVIVQQKYFIAEWSKTRDGTCLLGDSAISAGRCVK